MISILLPTNRINKFIIPKIDNLRDGLDSLGRYDRIFTDEFVDLARSRLEDVKHYLEPTLISLEKQKYKNFELIISHRYPKDALDVVKSYNIKLKLVEEKPSIWHCLGDYSTLNNNINTAFIHSSGELLWRLDDLIFFNDSVLSEISYLWSKNLYMTSRAIRCIDFDSDKRNVRKLEKIGPNKYRITYNGISGEVKKLVNKENHPAIPNFMCWGYSSTISRKDFLAINGQDELYDGAVCGTDMDLGARLSRVSRHGRVVSDHYIYEINDVRYKNNIRDDVIMRNLFQVNHIKGNSWKPSREQMELYKKWHTENKGKLDPNWNKFMEVPFIDLRKEYEKKSLGKIIWEN